MPSTNFYSLSNSLEKMKLVLAALLGVFVTPYLCEPHHFLTDIFIKSINDKKSTWTAKRNFPEDTPIEELRRLAGVKPTNITLPMKPPAKFKADNIPDTFDSRDVWPFCESLRQIRNQGGCGSCWAFGAVEVMTDRICIFSGGSQKFTFSPEELITCCGNCGGCGGGNFFAAFDYWVTNGIPSGGDQPTNEGCRPYSAEDGHQPACNKQCVPWYDKSYDDDLRYGVTSYRVSTEVESIQNEILINGPVETSYEVFEDFYNYGTGVYQHVSGNSVGYHAVKILGWGTENGVPYWLVANSWGSGWGGDGGFFKIVRGSNHCNFEKDLVAGIPRI